MVDTVKFNVGGRHFEVSRALIDAHSETMLGRLVSDTWNENHEKTVFIDRNGDVYPHVLDYLRYGKIELPVTVPRSTFNRELDFYGIPLDESMINQESLAALDSTIVPVKEAQIVDVATWDLNRVAELENQLIDKEAENAKLMFDKDKLEFYTKKTLQRFQENYLAALQDCKAKIKEMDDAIEALKEKRLEERRQHAMTVAELQSLRNQPLWWIVLVVIIGICLKLT